MIRTCNATLRDDPLEQQEPALRLPLAPRWPHGVLKELFQRSAAGVRPSYGGHPARLDEGYAPRVRPGQGSPWGARAGVPR